MFKFLSCLMMANLFLVGCAGTAGMTQSREATIALKGGKRSLAVVVQSKNGIVEDRLTLLVNGTAIASQSLTQFKPNAVLTGQFETHLIEAECGTTPLNGGFMTGHHCDIYVDKSKSSDITF